MKIKKNCVKKYLNEIDDYKKDFVIIFIGGFGL